ncbi:MAG: flagellar assembly protein FliW [Holophaga sp.]|nr:flagellar assembly protein FliW [Holophaga sp.]
MSEEEIIVKFPKGLVGSPELNEFRVFEPEGGPLKFLQSTLKPEIFFTCMDAAAVKADYQVPLTEKEAEELNLQSEKEAMVLVMVIHHEELHQTTANLAGPLVINTRTHLGIQAALEIKKFPLQYPLFAAKEDLAIDFPAGLLGFPHLRAFRLFEPADSYPLKFFQSADDPDICFTCIDIASIQPNYEFSLNDEDAEALALEAPEDALLLAMVVIPQDPRKMTANLAGPLIINGKTCVGRQIVLNTEKFPLKFPILS